MKNLIKLFALVISILISACQPKKIEFTKLEEFSKIDTMLNNGQPYYYKTDCYIVENYKDNLDNEKLVDSFVYKNKAIDLKQYSGYSIVVYKKSAVTNVENLRKNPRDFDATTFDNDVLYTYRWSNGTWSNKMKFNGRETVEAQPMIRED